MWSPGREEKPGNTQEGMTELSWVVKRKKAERPEWAKAWGPL